MKKFINRCSRGLEVPMFWLGGIFALSLVWRFIKTPHVMITAYDIFQLLAWTAFGIFSMLVPLRNWTDNKKFYRFVVIGIRISVGVVVIVFLLQNWPST